MMTSWGLPAPQHQHFTMRHKGQLYSIYNTLFPHILPHGISKLHALLHQELGSIRVWLAP
jgi:hypothetical protein